MTPEHHPPHPDDSGGDNATERTESHPAIDPTSRTSQPEGAGPEEPRQGSTAVAATGISPDADQDPDNPVGAEEQALHPVTLTDPWNEREPLRIWVPDTADRTAVARALVDAAAHARTHGPAFLAYLKLPDVDATNPAVEDAFTNHYIGSFASTDQLIDELTEVKDWKEAIASLANRLGITDFIHIDKTRLLARVYEIWDIVPGEGQLHVFDK